MTDVPFYKAVFRPAVARANLSPETHPHTLRHTYASLCIAAVIPILEILRCTGHAKPSTTETVYVHLLRDEHSTSTAALGARATPHAVTDNVVPLVR